MNMQNALCFAGGLAVGSLAAFIFCRLRAKKADTEKVMDGEFVPVNDAPVDDWKEEQEQTNKDYSHIVDALYNHGGQDQGVTHYTPYLISLEDYDDESYADYEKETLTYYADGILARVDDEIIRHPDEIVGPNALSVLDETDEDVVYVRDDSAAIQYEIDRDTKPYSEVVGPIPDEDDYD